MGVWCARIEWNQCFSYGQASIALGECKGEGSHNAYVGMVPAFFFPVRCGSISYEFLVVMKVPIMAPKVKLE